MLCCVKKNTCGTDLYLLQVNSENLHGEIGHVKRIKRSKLPFENMQSLRSCCSHLWDSFGQGGCPFKLYHYCLFNNAKLSTIDDLKKKKIYFSQSPGLKQFE